MFAAPVGSVRNDKQRRRLRDRRVEEVPLDCDVLEERLLLYNFSGQSWADADYTEVLGALIASYEERYAYLAETGCPMTAEDIWRYELEPVIDTWIRQGLLPGNWEQILFSRTNASTMAETGAVDGQGLAGESFSYHSELPTDAMLDGLPAVARSTAAGTTSPEEAPILPLEPSSKSSVLVLSEQGLTSAGVSSTNTEDSDSRIQFHWDANAGVLRIDATAGDDAVTIAAQGGQLLAYHTMAEGPLQVFAISAQGVRGIHFLGGDGDDRFTNSTDIPCLADGGAGNDVLIGGRGNDVLLGGDGDDVIYGMEGHDFIDGGTGNDQLFGHTGNDTIIGGEGNDVITVTSGANELFGGAGDDTILGGSEDDFIDAGSGNDLVLAGAGNNFVDGGDGDDVLHGGDREDLLRGGPGNDQLYGYGGDDLLIGGPGNDLIIGGGGRDAIYPDDWTEEAEDPPATPDPIDETPSHGSDNGAGTGIGTSPSDSSGSDNEPGTPAGVVLNPEPITAMIAQVVDATTRNVLDSIRIVFSSAVRGLDLGDLSLTREYSDAGNLLTGAQTLTSDDGVVWVLGNLSSITRTAGAYNLVLHGVGSEIVGVTAGALQSGAATRFVVMPEVKPSDDFLRYIQNAGHHFWDHDRFANLDAMDGDSYLTLGTRITYKYDPVYAAGLTDPVAGTYGDPNRPSLRDVYQALYTKYKEEHPDAIVGSYVGGVSLKDAQKVLQFGQWPPDAHSISAFDPAWLAPVISTSAFNNATVNLSIPEARQALYQEHLKRILGLGTTHKQDVVEFDEVGYTLNSWKYNVEIYSKLKKEANNQGVLVAINLGGWGWTDPFPIVSSRILEEIPQMADIVTIEAPWSLGQAAQDGTYRTVPNTVKLINNLRTVMDQGVTIGLLPTHWDINANTFDIVNAQEVVQDGKSMLLVKLNRPHHIWPSSGSVYEQFKLKDLPAAYKGLQNVQWTALEVPGKPEHVVLYSRSGSLDLLKKEAGITGAIQFTGGRFHDYQANTRLLAGFATLLRRPGDRIFVNYSPGAEFPGGGDPNHPDNWWYWPEQLGNPTAEYVINSVDTQGQILHMFRQFEKGVLHLYPKEGWVDLKLFSATA